jgi:hypothetical protein
LPYKNVTASPASKILYMGAKGKWVGWGRGTDLALGSFYRNKALRCYVGDTIKEVRCIEGV